MEIEQKKSQFMGYIESEYSTTSFYYLNLFAHNFALCCDVVLLDGVTIKFLEEGKIKHTYPPEVLKSLQHMIVLSALSKIMVLIESFLRVTEALSKNYKTLPSRMLEYYSPDSLNKVLDKAKYETWEKDEIWRVFGFPYTEDLPLTQDEKDVAEKVLNHGVELIKTFYKSIARFYDDHRISYNKFKHGLSVVVGLEPTTTILDNPLILVMDVHKKINRIRCNCLIGKLKLPGEYELFNAISVIPMREATINEFSGILADMKGLVQAIADNHFVRGINCGIGYLPKNIHTAKDFPEDIFKTFQKIADEKIAPMTYLMQPPTFKFEIDFGKPLSESLRIHFEKENIATIIIDRKPNEEVRDM